MALFDGLPAELNELVWSKKVIVKSYSWSSEKIVSKLPSVKLLAVAEKDMLPSPGNFALLS